MCCVQTRLGRLRVSSRYHEVGTQRLRVTGLVEEERDWELDMLDAVEVLDLGEQIVNTKRLSVYIFHRRNSPRDSPVDWHYRS